ncbi:MAG TPA: bifunctional UDP-sugar hydrolase/5'-nucleotidase [Alphaproteobacteria bacterium]|jgi:2',3'-cyclic-nucleotide 2'-phosphodiesterase (5'-nucleotidase family)|nr:bifunctional UDP-sugar hydrolase/5'-nucleotidase [Alphaproteobacteria bacterium]
MTTGFRIFIAVLTLAWLPAAALGQSGNLTLLHVNDVYEIAAKKGQGGLAQLMTLLKAERARAEHHLTTLGGDLLSPSVLSGLTQGKQMIEVFNALGLDAAGLGNHEFDFGSEVLRRRAAESKFPWLASNTLDAEGRPLVGQAMLIRQMGPFKVGLFGLLTPETKHLSSPGAGVRFAPVVETAKATVAALREQQADLVIALTHLDLSADRALVRAVPGIDVILGGHDHDPIMIYERGTLIAKAGYDAHYLAVIDLAIEKKQGRRGPKTVIRPQWRLVSTHGVEPNAEVAAIVAGYEQLLAKELDVALGKTDTPLDSRRASVRGGESAIGNLIADALRAAVGADVALTNGGGIRGDRIYEAGATLSRKDVLGELPFGNVTLLLEVSGTELKAALENGVSRVEDTAGRFPQVSGLRFVFDPARPSGSRVLEVVVAGRALDPDRRYRLATSDYIANGGDGYAVLKGARRLIDASAAKLMATMVMDHIAAQKSVAPKIEGRIARH